MYPPQMPLTSAVGRAPTRSSELNPRSPVSARDLVTSRNSDSSKGTCPNSSRSAGVQLENVVVEPGYLHPSVLIVQGRDEAGDRRRRVRDGAAEDARVQIEVGAVEVDRGEHQPAHAGHRAGLVGGDHAGVGDHDHVAVEPVAVRGEQGLRSSASPTPPRPRSGTSGAPPGSSARSRAGGRAARAGGIAAGPCRRRRRGPAAGHRRWSARTAGAPTARSDQPAARRGGRRRERSRRRDRRWAIRRRPPAGSRSARSRRSGSRHRGRPGRTTRRWPGRRRDVRAAR